MTDWLTGIFCFPLHIPLHCFTTFFYIFSVFLTHIILLLLLLGAGRLAAVVIHSQIDSLTWGGREEEAEETLEIWTESKPLDAIDYFVNIV